MLSPCFFIKSLFVVLVLLILAVMGALVAVLVVALHAASLLSDVLLRA